jgi:hypothetical protein
MRISNPSIVLTIHRWLQRSCRLLPKFAQSPNHQIHALQKPVHSQSCQSDGQRVERPAPATICDNQSPDIRYQDNARDQHRLLDSESPFDRLGLQFRVNVDGISSDGCMLRRRKRDAQLTFKVVSANKNELLNGLTSCARYCQDQT